MIPKEPRTVGVALPERWRDSPKAKEPLEEGVGEAECGSSHNAASIVDVTEGLPAF
jgi:hypothetical protein